MRWVKALVFGLPAVLLLLTAAALWSVARSAADPKNEMYIGSIAEPTKLNPIQQADSAAGAVEGMLFNGLMKYSAELELAPDLAEGWTLRQRSTFFFGSPEEAVQAAANMEAGLADREGSHLTRYEVEGHRLVLDLEVPGLVDSRKLAALFHPVTPQPVHTLAAAGSAALEQAVAGFAAADPAARVVRAWASGTTAEIAFLGDPQQVQGRFAAYLQEQTGSKVQVAAVEAPDFLAEPEVTFRLRPGVRWHDGRPFTSRDVAFTYGAIMDDRFASPRKPDYELVGRLETPDALTVKVVYRRPFSPALESWMIGLLPAHILEGKDPGWWAENFNRRPVGTGPFKFAEWRTNQYVRVVRNPDYFRGSPSLEAVVFRVLPDPLTLRLAFESRQVDFWGVDPWAVGSFSGDPRFEVFSAPGNSYTYIGWNLRRPLFADLRVRQALAHAVNVPQMVRYLLYGHGVQSTGIFTPRMWFFNPRVEPLAYDPERAKALLAEAGWTPGADGILQKDGRRFSFTLITNNGNEVRRDIATLAQADLRAVGIEVRIELYEWAVFLKNFVNCGEFDAVVLGWALGQGFDQFQIWHSSQANPEQLNMVGFKDARSDRLLEDIRAEFERGRIISMCHELQQRIYDLQPYLFLYVPEGTSVMWRDAFRVRRPGPDGRWIEEPVQMTKAGWNYHLEWFYRPGTPPPPPPPVEARES